MTEIEIPKSISKIIDDQIEAYPLTPEDRDLHRTKLRLFAEFGYRLAASSNTVAPVDNIRWVKASERLPEKCGEENGVIIVNNEEGRYFAAISFRNFDKENPRLCFSLGNKFLVTTKGEADYHTTFPIKNICWLEKQTSPVDNIVESEEKWIKFHKQRVMFGYEDHMKEGIVEGYHPLWGVVIFVPSNVLVPYHYVREELIEWPKEQTKEVSTNLK